MSSRCCGSSWRQLVLAVEEQGDPLVSCCIVVEVTPQSNVAVCTLSIVGVGVSLIDKF